MDGKWNALACVIKLTLFLFGWFCIFVIFSDFSVVFSLFFCGWVLLSPWMGLLIDKPQMKRMGAVSRDRAVSF